MYSLLRKLLFLLSPEKAHHITFSLFHGLLAIPGLGWLIRKVYSYENESLAREVFGLRFPNPVGLAAGLDKNGEYIDDLAGLGFGFIEVGTVTPLPQPGNPKPRLFRLQKDQALINRMGFNNDGVKQLVIRLKKRQRNIIVGGNIGKNKITPNASAATDYIKCFEALYPWVDYFVVNVSSPNTPNLRDLQEKEPLTHLLNELQHLNRQQQAPKPILLKIAPDLSDGQLDDIINIVRETGIAGVIAINTTISRENLHTGDHRLRQIGPGGLSGRPLTNRSTEVIRYLAEKSGKAFPIIGVGGILSAADALEKLEAGADLIQVYTGLIYEGPGLIKKIKKHFAATYH